MKIAVVGTGYVGLVTGTCLAEVGIQVTCVDIDEKKIAGLKAGIMPIYEPGLEEMVIRNFQKGKLNFSTSLKEAIVDCDVAFIAVGTPPGEDGSADLKYVLDLNEQTSTVYMDGFKINTLNFNTVEKNGNVYVITIKDENIYDGTLLMTKFTLDTSKNLLVYQWYDEYYNLTIVQTFKQTTEISNY